MSSQPKELDPKLVDIKEEEKYQLGVQAFVWGCPVIEMYRQAEGRTSGPGQNGTNAPINAFGHARELVTAAWDSGLYPNSDTLYSMAWLDLTKEALVLKVPKMDQIGDKERYYVLPLFNAFNELFFSIGTSNDEAGMGEYLIYGPDWKGEVPDGLTPVASPTQLVWILGRTLINGADDLAAVHTIQDGYTLTPLSQYQPGFSNPPTAFSPKMKDGQVRPMPTGIEYFSTLSKLMEKETMPAAESLLWKTFERIDLYASTDDEGFKPKDFSPNPTTTAGLKRAASAAANILDAQFQGVIRNGWMYNLELGIYSEYFARGLGAWVSGAGANAPNESVYLRSAWDDSKEELLSSERYEIRFESGSLPPVEAFWSISMYGSNQNPVANDLERCSIGDRTEGMEFGEDGSLTIYIQSQAPNQGTNNWLPCPDPLKDENFVLYIRAYMPAQEIIDLEYLFPQIRKV